MSPVGPLGNSKTLSVVLAVRIGRKAGYFLPHFWNSSRQDHRPERHYARMTLEAASTACESWPAGKAGQGHVDGHVGSHVRRNLAQ